MRGSFLALFCVWCAIVAALIISNSAVHAEEEEEDVWGWGSDLVKRGKRRTVVSTEYGQISAVGVSDSINGSYLLHFFTLEPNSLFLPAILHADMIFYVQTGSGKLSWTGENGLESTELTRGDVYALRQGAVFFIQSNLETETERQKLRIYALFANLHNGLQAPETGPYSSIRDMVVGFDRRVLQAAFRVPEDVIDELLNGTDQPAIKHAAPRTKRTAWEAEAEFVKSLLGSRRYNIFELNKKKKKSGARAYNLFKEDKDFENSNGWSTTVTRKKLSALKGSDIGVFMVNLTAGSMMGPHWNPMASEIAVVLQGRGMIRTVCSSLSNKTRRQNRRFEVKEGDVFVVPRFHPMAQMAFNNETFVFMGFSTSTKRNHPQFLAGQASVLRTLDRDVLAMSFDVANTTLDQLLAAEKDSVILSCIACAEEELSVMQEEIEREQEEARQREEEEEARKREEERRREEEEARRQEEERKRQEEQEERKRQEEEARRREEKEAEERRQQEEEARRREEEEAARRQEEEKRRQEEQEQEAAGRREEEARRREEEEAKEREQEQEEKRKRQEKEAARREEEEARRREEEANQREQKQEEERRRQQEEARQREEEAARTRRAEKERIRQEEEEEEEEAAQREEEERIRRQEVQEARRREEKARQREEEGAAQREEEERTRRQEEEEEEPKRQEEQARRRQEEQGRRSEEEEAAEEERRMEEETQRAEEAARQKRQEQEGGEEQEEEQGGDG